MKFSEQVAEAYRTTGVQPIRETYYDKGAMCGLTAWMHARHEYRPVNDYDTHTAVMMRFSNDHARAGFISGFDGEEEAPWPSKRTSVVWHAIGREAARLVFGEEGGE